MARGSSPIRCSPGAKTATNMGSYLSFEGSSFTWMPGAGRRRRARRRLLHTDRRMARRPCTDHDHAAAGAARGLARVRTRAVHRRDFRTRAAPAGDFDAQALAVGADGVVARYTPGHGWEREFLQTSSGAVSSPTLRAVAWPEPNRAFAVGDLGAMWIWRAETGLWEKDPAAPLDGFQGNLDGIAFDPSESGARLRRRSERRAAQVRQELDAGRRTTGRLLRKPTSHRSLLPARRRWLSPNTTCSSTKARAGRSNPKSMRCSRACQKPQALNVVAGPAERGCRAGWT